MVPMHYNTFRLGREPMDEPLPRLMRAAESAGVEDCVHPLAEGESWLAPASFAESACDPDFSTRDAADEASSARAAARTHGIGERLEEALRISRWNCNIHL